MAAEIKKRKGIEATLVRGSGGEFEITLDGTLLFSKKQQGRFPEFDEVLAALPGA